MALIILFRKQTKTELRYNTRREKKPHSITPCLFFAVQGDGVITVTEEYILMNM